MTWCIICYKLLQKSTWRFHEAPVLTYLYLLYAYCHAYIYFFLGYPVKTIGDWSIRVGVRLQVVKASWSPKTDTCSSIPMLPKQMGSQVSIGLNPLGPWSANKKHKKKQKMPPSREHVSLSYNRLWCVRRKEKRKLYSTRATTVC